LGARHLQFSSLLVVGRRLADDWPEAMTVERTIHDETIEAMHLVHRGTC
jgi:hypothetical protein